MIIIAKDFVHPYFSERVLDKDAQKKKVEIKRKFFEIGKLYSLQGETCEDFKMPIKIYKLVAIVKTLNDIKLNSIVVKEVTESDSNIFSLTKLDCSLLGVPFQRGLELYPMSLEWRLVNEESKEKVVENNFDMKYFSSTDLSTYPINRGDKTIKNMLVEINWSDFCKNSVEPITNINPSNIVFNYSDDLKNMFREIMIIPYYYGVKSKIVTKDVSKNPSPYSNLLDLNGNIYFELSFLFKTTKGVGENIGLLPDLLKNKTLCDIIQVSVNNEQKINVSVEDGKKKVEEVLGNRHNIHSSLEAIMNEYYKDRNRGRKDLLDVFSEIKRVTKLSESLDKHFSSIYELKQPITHDKVYRISQWVNDNEDDDDEMPW